jgi:hypothetical protein
VDLDYGELGHNRDVDLGICGDAAAVLTQPTDALGSQGSKSDDWLRTLREVEEESASQAAASLNMERARASGKPSCVNVILNPDIYSSGTMNQTMYK